MKKLFYSIIALAIAGLSFTSCEDVPMPYDMTIEDHGGTGVPPQSLQLVKELKHRHIM